METRAHDPIAFLNRLYKETGYSFDDIALYNIRDDGFRCNRIRLNIRDNKDNTIVMIKLQPLSNIPVVKIKNSIHITIGVFKDVDKNYLKKQGYEMMRDILGEDILIRDLLLVGHISHSCSLVINSNNADSASIYNFVISFRNRYLKNAIVSSFYPVHISFAHNGVAELLKKHQNMQIINDDNVQEEQAIHVDVLEQEVVHVDVQEHEVFVDVQEANRNVERIMPNIIDRALQYRTNAIDRAMQLRINVQAVQIITNTDVKADKIITNTDVQAVQTTDQASCQVSKTPLNSLAPIFYPNRVYRYCVVYPVYQYY